MGQAALHLAAQKGLDDVIKIFDNEKNAPVSIKSSNKFGVTPLHDAALEGQKYFVLLLIALGAQINNKSNGGWTPPR